ncbi:MAG TPA: ABC transporter substrate-binding protein [Burkholderiales bacterium]|nr:ABC transporter substrate-binding protein [Burkholderiales bacterium]
MRILATLVVALVLGVSVHAADLRIGLAADVTSMDPHFLNAGPNNLVAWHIFDALTRVDENARLVPGLAESWKATDATTWEFRLRRGVKFHDGSELTAEDVVYSLNRPATIVNSPGSFVPFTRPIVSKQVVDRYTVRLRTAGPYAMVPYDLHSVFIVSKRAAEGVRTEEFNQGKGVIGTGPYYFVSFKRGDRMELARHDQYSGTRPAWDKVDLRIMPTDPARIAALLSGDVDAIEQVPTADLPKLRANAKFQVAQKVSWRTIFLHLDQSRDRVPGLTDRSGRPLDRNPFKDVRVRKAISMAINRQGIVERVMEGAALPASNLVAPQVFGHARELKPEPFDADGAKKLLADAGYPNGFSIVLHAPNNRWVNDDQVAQAIAQMLVRAGIATRVQTLPWNVYTTKARNREFGVSMLGWGSFSGDLALRTVIATFDAEKGFGTWNWGRYSNPRLDRLVTQALATLDEGKREGIAREAMTVAMQDYALIPLHHQISSWAMRKGLGYTARTDEYTLAHQFRAQ